ncbi:MULTISPECIES: helix-turn-helix domain-containing protein [unclassified Shinella]|uniref:helix-turn-helix domain-containing protein n=1 Tax=unclassified Shinella TaxID=2643062 RepID=UPI00234E940C|nr:MULTISPECIES: short-chain fatty acyl-CoA regulator family protein [unclassified Shinella]MCO5154019.1 short-chain fatty acyl-CoA regulator family protein [Shinella sp.]MDC7266938.1 short-chain fatty acyl-CoA regulator family protein [Shinella sp. HY16]MDC7273835.1 short-chain fatty acyl-CoA regulator family protein [Shinella sp. YZ44]
MEKSGVYLGPRLRRLRRDLGLTQANMALDLEISPSYIALMERNQRPVTAETLLKLAKAYKVDFSEFSDNSGNDLSARMQAVIRDPVLSDIDFEPLEIADVAHSFPAFAEALLRLHTAFREEQFALADRRQEKGVDGGLPLNDAVTEIRSFLSARRNCFPLLDAASEKLAARVAETGDLANYLKQRHGLRVRRLPSEVMTGSQRRLDLHRKELLFDDTLDLVSQNFQMAQQIAYLEFEAEIVAATEEGNLKGDNARLLAHRALAGYSAAAILMPYAAFARAVEARHYDIEALARQFGTSFEQTAHRLTTLQRPGQERVPFFFIRVDTAGNVSKRLNSANFPFARHGGGCPLWTVHQVFTQPRKIVTQWLELPDGLKFFSIARTVNAGGGSFGTATIERAVALVCEAQHAERLVYARQGPKPEAPTPIGITCRLCHRTACRARSEPPIGRQILADNYRRTDAPFGFSD